MNDTERLREILSSNHGNSVFGESFDEETAIAQLQALLDEARLRAAIFALDNETLWQYTRKCNAGEASKADKRWLLELLRHNISAYKNRLANLTPRKEQ